jgi:hypothetical protein
MLAVKRSISGARHTALASRLRDHVDAALTSRLVGATAVSSPAARSEAVLLALYDTFELEQALLRL